MSINSFVSKNNKGKPSLFSDKKDRETLFNLTSNVKIVKEKSIVELKIVDNELKIVDVD